MNGSTEEWQTLLGTIGSAIRSFRVARHLTQNEAAAKAGLSLKALASLERGEGSSLETFVRALQALGATHVIETMAPRPRVSPIALLKSDRPPQRVRHRLTP